MLNREDILKISNLARLELNENDIEKFRGQLNEILDYMEKLGEVDTSNVESLAHAFDVKNAIREDVIIESIPNETALQNAPEKDKDSFVVPKVVG